MKIYICDVFIRYFIFIDTKLIESEGRHQYLERGDLLITDVKLEDAGKYTCRRSNEDGTVEASANLNVLGEHFNIQHFCFWLRFVNITVISLYLCVFSVRTQIIQPPADTTVLLGHVAVLKCKVSGDPAVPYQINWSHNNRYTYWVLVVIGVFHRMLKLNLEIDLTARLTEQINV